MPYASTLDPPPAVQQLPPHAQEIFRSAFNGAWQSYAGRVDQEEIAFRVAWAAVKKNYRKTGRQWVARKGATSHRRCG